MNQLRKKQITSHKQAPFNSFGTVRIRPDAKTIENKCGVLIAPNLVLFNGEYPKEKCRDQARLATYFEFIPFATPEKTFPVQAVRFSSNKNDYFALLILQEGVEEVKQQQMTTMNPDLTHKDFMRKKTPISVTLCRDKTCETVLTKFDKLEVPKLYFEFDEELPEFLGSPIWMEKEKDIFYLLGFYKQFDKSKKKDMTYFGFFLSKEHQSTILKWAESLLPPLSSPQFDSLNPFFHSKRILFSLGQIIGQEECPTEELEKLSLVKYVATGQDTDALRAYINNSITIRGINTVLNIDARGFESDFLETASMPVSFFTSVYTTMKNLAENQMFFKENKALFKYCIFDSQEKFNLTYKKLNDANNKNAEGGFILYETLILSEDSEMMNYFTSYGGKYMIILKILPSQMQENDSYQSPIDVSQYLSSDKSDKKMYILPPFTYYTFKDSRTIRNFIPEIEVVPRYNFNFLKTANLCKPLSNFREILQNRQAVVKYINDNPLLDLEEPDASFPDSKTTLLYYSAKRLENLDVIKALCENCAYVNCKSSTHLSTPLHSACYNNQEIIAQYLLDQGAIPELENNQQKTALTEARENGFSAIVSLLENYPKKPPLQIKLSRFNAGFPHILHGCIDFSFSRLKDQLFYVSDIKTVEEECAKPVKWKDIDGEHTLAECYQMLINSQQYHSIQASFKAQVTELEGKLKSCDHSSHQYRRIQSLIKYQMPSEDEILALGLYQTPAFYQINNYLDFSYNDNRKADAQLINTANALVNGYAKIFEMNLSKAPVCIQFIQENEVPENFFKPDKTNGEIFFINAGFSTATTDDLSPEKYVDLNRHYIKLIIHQKDTDFSGFHRGVDISWFSFTNQSEILFPPWTAFEIISRKRYGNEFLVEVIPTYLIDSQISQ